MLHYRKSYYVLRPHRLVKDLYDEVRWFIQRGRRGYSDRDVWSLDWYLLSWMPQALEQLKRTKHGHPVTMTAKSWSKELDNMIRGLRDAKKMQELDYNEKEFKAIQKSASKGLDLLRKHWFSLWD